MHSDMLTCHVYQPNYSRNNHTKKAGLFLSELLGRSPCCKWLLVPAECHLNSKKKKQTTFQLAKDEMVMTCHVSL